MNVDAFIQRFSAGLAVMEELPLPQARRTYVELCQTFAPPDPAGMQIENSALGGVSVRRFTPQQQTPGCVLFIHGGGFTIGSAESHHGPAASLAQMLEREVVSVNYRLAPEVDYPTMLADCRTVLEAIYPVALVGDRSTQLLARFPLNAWEKMRRYLHATTCSAFANSVLTSLLLSGIATRLPQALKC